MPFIVAPATDADIGKIMSIVFDAYGGNNDCINSVFPKGLTPEGHRLNVERMLFIKSVAPGL
jgi:hypothetical protein